MGKAKKMNCSPARFQRGDKVKTISGKVGYISAVGVQSFAGRLFAVVYRVGRNQYYHEWQISLLRGCRGGH